MDNESSESISGLLSNALSRNSNTKALGNATAAHTFDMESHVRGGQRRSRQESGLSERMKAAISLNLPQCE